MYLYVVRCLLYILSQMFKSKPRVIIFIMLISIYGIYYEITQRIMLRLFESDQWRRLHLEEKRNQTEKVRRGPKTHWQYLIDKDSKLNDLITLGCLHAHNEKCLQAIREQVDDMLYQNLLTLKGQGCKVPQLDPYSYDALQFMKKVKKIVCEGENWITCHVESLFSVVVAFTFDGKGKSLNLTDGLFWHTRTKENKCKISELVHGKYFDVQCLIRDILFKTDFSNELGDAVPLSGFDSYVLNRSDFINVTCEDSGNTSWTGLAAGVREVALPPTLFLRDQHNKKKYSILMYLFDSTSKNGFVRHMKKSYEYLVKQLDAVVLNGYNIIGDGTTANLLAILTGLRELELPEARVGAADAVTVDFFPMIWKLLKKIGYATAFHEDCSYIGTFTLRLKGFVKQPTDHYLRILDAENNRNSHRPFCMGAIPRHIQMSQLTEQFMRMNKNVPKFILSFHGEISHDSISGLEVVDEDFMKFLKRIKEGELLEDTVMFVMSDHGPRFHAFRNTYQGKIEERLPFVSIILPPSIRKLHPDWHDNLIQNSASDVLTTPFDIHATLLDVVRLEQYKVDNKVPGADIERSLSIFRPIARNRTCPEAGVEAHWCTCVLWTPVSNETLSNWLANALTSYINILTGDESESCAHRSYQKVVSVEMMVINEDLLTFRYRRDLDGHIGDFTGLIPIRFYQIKVIMSPANAIFEALLTEEIYTGRIRVKSSDISRIDRYGNQSHCILKRRPDIGKFCYCKP